MNKKIAGFILGAMVFASACGSNVPGETADNTKTDESITSEAKTEEAMNVEEEASNDEAVVSGNDNSSEEASDNDSQEDDTEENTAPEGTETDATEDIETSPLALWDYTGYVDECLQYYWKDDFINKDYDCDGKTDRLHRSYHEEEQKADYVLELGNGNKIELGGVWDTGFPHVEMEDLNGDGEKDLLFTLSYDTSTDPLAFGNMLIYEYDSANNGYKQAELPFEKSEDVGSTDILVEYDAPSQEGNISFNIPKIGYSGEILAGTEFVQNFWTNDKTSESCNVYEASIRDYDGKKAVLCNVELLHKFGGLITFYIVNENGEYVIKDINSSDESVKGKITDLSSNDDANVSEEPAPAAETPHTGGHLVVIDPGHQSHGMSEKEPNGPGSTDMKAKVTGGTTGKTTGIAEYQLTLTIGLKLKEELTKRGYTVIMTRESNDVSLSNVDRAQIANNAGAEAFIRIHANGSEDTSVNGAMTICQTPSNPYNAAYYDASRKLSDCVLDSYINATGFKKQYVWETDTMTGINWANVPSTIIEMGYMSNPTDDTNMADEAMQQQMVNGIANGIDTYFN
ncbi:N-acetylmuramoyl-L-alanine amidase [Butyrivibrio sp. JL13D10]|uniref:N-acetylmuramoyl-L-alanine amidase family protein n=1 Tax=Butyrivibrio sp. JL13D10 TaxID=3236815 RepID=UPI0038B5CF87